MELWALCDCDLKLSIPKKNIQEMFLMSKTRFLNDLRLLNREGLVDMHETKTQYGIELTGWDDDDDLD